MSLNVNGVTTTKGRNTFNFEKFTTGVGRKKITRIQWDYRDRNGVLHTGVAKSLHEAMYQAGEFGYTGK